MIQSCGSNEMDPPLCGSTAMSHNEFQSSEPMEPQEASPMKQEMNVLGIDIAKHVFHAVGMDETGKVVFRKRVSRHDLMPFIAKLPLVLIGIEACGGAHDWARRFRAYGHEVKLMAPQFVKPYVKSNKNDSRDAEAIAEAVTRPPMRFVPIKDVGSRTWTSGSTGTEISGRDLIGKRPLHRLIDWSLANFHKVFKILEFGEFC